MKPRDWRILGYVVVGLLAMHWLNSRLDAGSTYGETTHDSKALLALGSRVQAQSDSLSQIRTAYAATALSATLGWQEALRRADSDSVVMASSSPQDGAGLLVKETGLLRVALRSCGQANAALASDTTVCGQQVALWHARADTLQSQLARQLKVKPPCGLVLAAGAGITSRGWGVFAGPVVCWKP